MYIDTNNIVDVCSGFVLRLRFIVDFYCTKRPASIMEAGLFVRDFQGAVSLRWKVCG